MQDVVAIDSRNLRSRAVLITAIVVALVFAGLAIRWQLGNMLASLTPAGDPNSAMIFEIAAAWAPGDPSAQWRNASANHTVEMYEQTVRLAPYDYRWRVELARALEQDEQADRAEIEFKKAIELAPSYAFTHWHLGNFYLRENRIDEAVSELRSAAGNNPSYRDQVFSLAWDYFEKDAAQVENLADNSPEARARLAYFFAARGRAGDSLRNWNMLSETEKAANPVIAKSMAHGLYNQRYFPQSLEFSRQLGFDVDARPEAVTDGGFEKGLNESADSRFSWRPVRNDPRLDITSDSKVRREGNRSVRISFRNYVRRDFNNLFQTVVVEPNTRYRLRFYVRTENLKSAGVPLLDVANANDDKLIARSQVFPSGTNDWQEMVVEFTAPANCSGISLRTVRQACGDECPIAGTFWYDDFELVRQ